MKTFETPYIDVIKFTVADVITTSTEEEIPVFDPPCM